MNKKKRGNDVGIKVVQPDGATQWDPMTTCLQTMCCACDCAYVFWPFSISGIALWLLDFRGESLKEFSIFFFFWYMKEFSRITIKYTIFVKFWKSLDKQ